MRNFLDNLRYKLQQFMQGRYGVDEFSRFLTWAGIAVFFLSLFNALSFLRIPALALMIFSLFRTYSKNTDKRLRERTWYLGIRDKVKGFFSLLKKKWTDRKTQIYFRCPGCKKVLRVPRGKGTIKVTCPQCRQEIIKRT